MSGRELDTDGTDSYHPQHPWEQSAHALYLAPHNRTRANWPPVRDAKASGPSEAQIWREMPRGPLADYVRYSLAWLPPAGPQ